MTTAYDRIRAQEQHRRQRHDEQFVVVHWHNLKTGERGHGEPVPFKLANQVIEGVAPHYPDLIHIAIASK